MKKYESCRENGRDGWSAMGYNLVRVSVIGMSTARILNRNACAVYIATVVAVIRWRVPSRALSDSSRYA